MILQSRACRKGSKRIWSIRIGRKAPLYKAVRDNAKIDLEVVRDFIEFQLFSIHNQN